MTKNKPLILVGLCIALTFVLLATTATRRLSDKRNNPGETSPVVTLAGAPTPAWELKDVNGKMVKSSDFAGKVVILDFWATDKGLVVIGISLDQDGASAVKPFMEKMGINYPIVLGDETVVSAFGGIEGIPTTFIIDRDGNIVGKHVGYTPKTEFEADITSGGHLCMSPQTKPNTPTP